jgi:hypothetical protein
LVVQDNNELDGEDRVKRRFAARALGVGDPNDVPRRKAPADGRRHTRIPVRQIRERLRGDATSDAAAHNVNGVGNDDDMPPVIAQQRNTLLRDAPVSVVPVRAADAQRDQRRSDVSERLQRRCVVRLLCVRVSVCACVCCRCAFMCVDRVRAQ